VVFDHEVVQSVASYGGEGKRRLWKRVSLHFCNRITGGE